MTHHVDLDTITLKKAGVKVTKLKAGTYIFKVADKSSLHNFHLTGPGVDKKTSVKAVTTVTWKLTLKKGMGAGTDLWDWHYGFVVGQGKRRDGVIALMNELQLPSHIWYFRRGLPTRYSGPSLNAAQSAVAIETIEIAHEGLFQIPGIGFGGAAASAAVGAATKLGL